MERSDMSGRRAMHLACSRPDLSTGGCRGSTSAGTEAATWAAPTPCGFIGARAGATVFAGDVLKVLIPCMSWSG